jgi:hypothetical protein
MNVDGKTKNFWAAQTLESEDWCLWEAGTLRLWAKREHHEWRVMSIRQEEREEMSLSQSEAPPIGGTWKRWAFKAEAALITASPAMPERPVVVRPDAPLCIPRGNEVLFFVSIPISLQLHLGGHKKLLIHEEPTLILSQTWFGDPTAGELGYALRTGGSRDLEGVKKGQHRAICPILIRNTSEEELHFEKICLRAMHVNIYRGTHRLWTQQIQVSYRGENKFSEINIAKEPPSFEKALTLVGTAREPAPRDNFLRKSFDSLWSA